MGGTTVIMPAFEVQQFLHTIVDERINVLTSVPAIYWLAMNQPNFAEFDVHAVSLGRVRRCADCARRDRATARVLPERPSRKRVRADRDVVGSTFLPHEYCRDRPETVGFAAPVVELDLIDVDESSNVGELLIRGQNIVAGYWNKPEQTADTIVDGWLHTGDLARVDDDGFTQIVDRKKDMVNRGGENVYCVEVENALVQHPAVFEVAVMGVPDTMMGEKVGRGGRAAARHEADAEGDRRLRPRADRRLQGAAVHLIPCRASAAQSRRQGAEGLAPQRDGVGRPDPLSKKLVWVRKGPSRSRAGASARPSLRGSPAPSA